MLGKSLVVLQRASRVFIYDPDDFTLRYIPKTNGTLRAHTCSQQHYLNQGMSVNIERRAARRVQSAYNTSIYRAEAGGHSEFQNDLAYN